MFKIYLASLIDHIQKQSVFGKAVAPLYFVEFQKRGLPHAHILIILAHEYKPRTTEQIDTAVLAELPDDEELRAIVYRCMAHVAPCMRDGKCSKHDPKLFANVTNLEVEDTHPTYRRRSPTSGSREEKIAGRTINNVPYNPYPTKRYSCHINVELCSFIKPCKYLLLRVKDVDGYSTLKSLSASLLLWL